MEKFDIVGLISSSIENMKLQAPTGVELVTKFDSRITFITGDRERLTQVFTNLLSNALKFTNAGRIEVETFYVSTSNIIRIEFRDTGPGIPAAVLPKLFEKFATVDVAGRNRNGTGLGLYLCKKIIEQHGGIIEAQNKSDGGATFAVIIPTKLKPTELQSLT